MPFLISCVGLESESLLSLTLLVLRCKECSDFSGEVLSVDCENHKPQREAMAFQSAFILTTINKTCRPSFTTQGFQN